MDERRVENIRKFFDKVARDDPVHGYMCWQMEVLIS